MRSPTGKRRQTGKMPVAANKLFYSTCIVGLSWAVSRDYETLGPVRDFSGRFGQRVSPAISLRRITPTLATPCIREPKDQGSPAFTDGPWLNRDGLCNPTEWRRAESNPRRMTVSPLRQTFSANGQFANPRDAAPASPSVSVTCGGGVHRQQIARCLRERGCIDECRLVSAKSFWHLEFRFGPRDRERNVVFVPSLVSPWFESIWSILYSV